MAATRTDIAGMRSEMVRFATNVDQEQAASSGGERGGTKGLVNRAALP